jgi:hypothetical protein
MCSRVVRPARYPASCAELVPHGTSRPSVRTSVACLGVLALTGWCACLPDDPPVRGRLLYPGAGVLYPRFRVLDGEPWVLFDVRQARAEDGLSARMDLHLVRWSDGEERRVLADRADRREWPVVSDADRAGFYMTAERIAPDLGLPVADLVRLRLSSGPVETIADVMSYGLHPERRWFYYRKYVAGAPAPELHLRDLHGNDRSLGPAAGPVSFFGEDRFYFLHGPQRTLSRVSGLAGGLVEELYPRVSRFWLHGAGRFAVIATSDEAGVHTRLLDLDTRVARALPVDNPCCWLGLEGDTFIYAEAAVGDRAAVLHRHDLGTGVDQALSLPEGLLDVQGMLERPPGGRETLLFDRRNRAALLRAAGAPGVEPGPEPSAQLLPIRIGSPAFSDDGRHLIFLDQEPPPPPPAIRRNQVGRLMAQDASDWQAPPWQLSPAGTTCLVDPRGYVPNASGPNQVMFWAHYGLGATDLYLADLDTQETRKLAVGVGPLIMLGTRLVGITRIGQDQTGDLVQKELLTSVEQLLEQGVATVTTRTDPTLGDIAAFVVKERNDSSPRNGLWAIPLPGF